MSIVAALLLVVLAVGSAHAQAPEAGTVLYLNRCTGGCTYSAGFPDDSITNRSSILSTTGTLTEYSWGDASFDQVVDCMVDLYAPFGVTVVDADPGAVPHLELAVAGEPGDLGFGSTGGVAPLDCTFIDNGIGFAFANIFGDDPRAICEQTAQISGHLVGLDRAFSCPDVMTFLSGCGDKSFTDANVQCGEFQARTCQCGGSTQNSFQELLAVYGARVPACGDGIEDAGETCDDGNTDPGDGCSATCQIEPPQAGTVLYLNRCAGGCTYTPGFPDNSITDRSSILGSTGTLTEYAWGDASFDQVVDCMVDLYAPFGVTIVDADPGAVPHLELAIAGDPADLGFGSVGGNSPFNCSFVDNGIAFAFANIFGDNPRAICEQAAQVSGSLAGLDHEFSCPDVMTFLSGCGDKSFTDADVQCGEFQARACACGGSTQNSFQTLSGLYGPGPVCGDGNQDPAETCDDGNTTPGDGCSDTCQIEAPAPLPLWGLAALGALLVLAVAIRTPSRLL